MSSAGDVNGDSIADLLIGSRFADPNGTNSGTTHVVFGTAAGFASNVNLATLDGANGFELRGAATFDGAGFSVSSAGDANGDGYDDLLISAPGADPNGDQSGASYLVFGTSAEWGATIDLATLDGSTVCGSAGETASDRSGWSVSADGDVDGDGFGDLLIGAGEADTNGADSGAAYVVFGTAAGFTANLNLAALDGTNGFQLRGESADDRFGFSVAAAGDINGDGFEDLFIGAPGADPNGVLPAPAMWCSARLTHLGPT